MGKMHWLAFAIGLGVGYFILPSVIGAVRSKLG